MDRRDEGLAFLLRYENVAWYESGTVRILDRRIYPVRIEFVTCHTHGEVAQAIADMVTQSGGPYTAAAMGMALAAWEARDKNAADALAFLEQAASHAGPCQTYHRSQDGAGHCPGAGAGENRPCGGRPRRGAGRAAAPKCDRSAGTSATLNMTAWRSIWPI